MSTSVVQKQGGVQDSAFCKFIRSFDSFGPPISLTYKGDENFKTVVGGFSTILVWITLLLYTTMQFMEVQQQASEVNEFHFYKNFLIDNTTLELNETNFEFAFTVRNVDPHFHQEELDTYVSMFFAQGYFQIEHGVYQEQLTYPHIDRCPFGTFKDDPTLELQHFYDNYFCLEHFHIYLEGGSSANNGSFGQLFINHCSQEFLEEKYPGENKTCKNASEIDDFILNAGLSVGILNYYFDEKEFDLSPIKYKIEYHWFPLATNIAQFTDILMSDNRVVQHDSWFSHLFDREESQLVGVQQGRQFLFNSGYAFSSNTLTSVRFSADLNVEIIERRRVTIWDALGAVGGLFGFLFPAFQVVLNFFQSVQYQSSLIKRLFLTVNQNFMKPNRVCDASVQDDDQIKDIISRETLCFSLMEYFRSQWFCCRSQVLMVRRRQFERGKEKLENLMDLTYILKQVKEVKFLKKIILTKYQRKLIPFFQKNNLDPCRELGLVKKKTWDQTVRSHKLEHYFKLALLKQQDCRTDQKIIKNIYYKKQKKKEGTKLGDLVIGQQFSLQFDKIKMIRNTADNQRTRNQEIEVEWDSLDKNIEELYSKRADP